MTGIFGANGIGFSFTGLSGAMPQSPLDIAKALIDAHSSKLGGLDYSALKSGLDTLAAQNPALAANVTDELKTQLGPTTFARLTGGGESGTPVNTYTGKPLGPLTGEQSIEDYMRPSLGSATELGNVDGWIKAVKEDGVGNVVERVKSEIAKDYPVDPALTGKSATVFSEWSNVATANRMNSLAGQIDKALAEHDQAGKFTDLKAFSTELRHASVMMDRSLEKSPASAWSGDYSFGNNCYASLSQMVSARMAYNHNQPVLTSTSDAQIAANWKAHQEDSYDRQLWTGEGPWTNGEITSMRYRTNGFDVNTSQAAGTFVSAIDGMAVGGAMRSRGPVSTTSVRPALEPISGSSISFSVSIRAAELQNSIPANSRGRITMGIGVAQDANGAQRTIIGTSEPNGYLRPGVSLKPGETIAPGLGHAEVDIVNYAQTNGMRLLEVGATRPVCASCVPVVEGAGAKIVTPIKE